ncbi:hypothetical protein V2J09_004064 [Rumex salicifolius]
MESSEDDDFSYHEGITPQSKINSVYQSDTEKGIRELCSELLQLKESVENLSGNTRTKYSAFLRLSEEVVEMQHELVELRRHMSGQGIMVQDLMSGICHELDEFVIADALETSQPPPQVGQFQAKLQREFDSSESTFLEKIDSLLAEHKVDDALEALELEEKNSVELRSSGDAALEVSSYRYAFLERKTELEDQMHRIAEQPSLGIGEFRKAISGLIRLGKGPLAHQLLMKRYGFRLQNTIDAFLPSRSAYPESYGAKLSQITFSTISLMARESDSAFGDNPVYTNKVLQWAEQQIESFVRLVKENGPPSESITALHAASICIQASHSQCSVLETQGLKFSKLLMVLLRPYFEEVLEMNFRRARRVVADMDDIHSNEYLLMSPRFVSPLSVFAVSSENFLIDSGLRFISIVKDIAEHLTPLVILHFGGNFLSRIPHLFDKFVDLLIKTLPSASEDDGLADLKEAVPFKAESDSQQLAVLGAAYTVADELLPMAISNVLKGHTEGPEPKSGIPEIIVSSAGTAVEYKDWRRQLQHSLDRLRDHFCQQYVLSFIYSREGKTRLDARIYLDGDGVDLLSDPDPSPSLPFQALFSKLRQLATVAGDVLLGKDKIQKILLARLTETVFIWLSDEQDFWSLFEDESVPLKPFGLQQLILDMHFTVEISRYASYSSRNVLQLASAITARAIKTYAARGIDLHSVLPEDEWFGEAAKTAITKLLSGASGSDASESEEEEEPLGAGGSHLDIASDSEDDGLSCPSTVDSFHSFVSAETGDLESLELSSQE